MSERGKSNRDKQVRIFGVGLALLGVVVAVVWTDPGKGVSGIDRIFSAAFVAFAVGLVELFLALVGLVILGKIDLPKVFQDKDGQLTVDEGQDGEPQFVRAVAGKGAVSLSRLQAFLWTLVIMVIYFHKAVSDSHGELPTIPSELLLVMGISGAVYLAGKELATRDAKTVIVHKEGSDAAGKGATNAKPDGKETNGSQVVANRGATGAGAAGADAGKITPPATPGEPNPAGRAPKAGEAGNQNQPTDTTGIGQAARLGLEGGPA